MVPRFAIPARLRDQFPGGRLSTALTVATLVFVFLAPVAAQYDCLFEELLVWEYTVSHDFDLDSAGRAISRYVDRERSRWPFGLQDEAVQVRHKDRDARTIYVHAQGQFAKNRELTPSQAFRRNLGPEVFLPWQPWLYLVMMVLSFAGGVWTFLRLIRLPSEFRT